MKLFGIPYQLRQLEYVLGDALLGVLSIYLGQVILSGVAAPQLWDVLGQYPAAGVFHICSSMIVLYLVDAYNADHDFRRRFEVMRLWGGLGVAMPIQLTISALLPDFWWEALVTLINLLSFGGLLTVWRYLLCNIGPQPYFRQRMIIVGAGQAGHLLARLVRENPEFSSRYPIVGFVDQPREGNRRRSDFPEDDRIEVEGAPPVLGSVGDLESLARAHQVDIIVVALRGAMGIDLMKSLLACKMRGVVIDDMPSLYKQLAGKVPILHLTESWLIFGPMFAGSGRFGMAMERVADIAVALVGLVFSAPFVGLAAVAIKLESPGPVFYLQERLGKNERPFMIIKLRTMRKDAEAKTGAVWSQGAGDPRVTRVGKFLRRTRIDELPQFYNVLRGDMAIQGPRPEREHFIRQLKEKIPFYGLRFSVKPGVTGWAQVSYRYGASVDDAMEKLCYELYAIQELSPALYLLILVKTVQTVLVKPGS